MKAFANLSIRNKLVAIILTATLVPLGSGFGLVVIKTRELLRDDLKGNVEVIGEMVADKYAFNVWQEMEEETDEDLAKTLAAVDWVTDVYLFQDDRQIFAQFARSGIVRLPEHVPEGKRTGFVGDSVEAFTRILRPLEATADDPEILGIVFVRASTEPYQEKLRDTWTFLGLLLAAVIAAAALLAYALQGVISKPILYLAEMAERISTNADYSIRVPRPGRDEIGTLYDGFNNMLEQIQRRQEDLERSNRDLDQFAYVASHDLKAPLRAIATLSGWIEEDLQDKLSPEAYEQMRLLRSRVQRMDGLIEGILQYSRVGRMDSHGERVDISLLLGEIVDFLAPPDGFQVEIAPDMPTLVTKRLRLEQVFSNLINNAIKYHDREDGRVEVTVRRLGRFFEFSVSDDGPGIAEEHHDKVFMMFQTLQPRDQMESTGLGLSLVKKLVEEEGGAVSLSSELGKGAAFRFTWPAVVEGVSSSEEQPS